MKKLLKAIAFIACLVFPLSAMAMSSMGDSDLSTVTGQAGVSINLDIQMDLSATTVAWGDADGLGDAGVNTTQGWVGLSGLNATNIRIRARQDLLTRAWGTTANSTLGDGQNFVLLGNNVAASFKNVASLVYAYAVITSNTQLQGYLMYPQEAHNMTAILTYVATNSAAMDTALTGIGKGGQIIPAYGAFGTAHSNLTTWLAGPPVRSDIKAASDAFIPLTIDVGTDKYGALGYTAGTTFVRIGLGSIEIGVGSLGANVSLGATHSLDASQVLGSIYLNTLLVNINGLSYVDIYAPTGKQGVNLNLQVTMDNINAQSISWGDADGFVFAGNTGLPGYVGLADLAINTMTLNGTVTVNVATDTTGALYAANTTFVRLGFAGLIVGIGSLDAKAVVGSIADVGHKSGLGTLDTSTVLGSLYIDTLYLTFTGGQVDIYANIGKSGVNLNMNLDMQLTANTIAWGDSDGVAINMGGSTGYVGFAGWVGLKTLNIKDMTIIGGAQIDVATSTGVSASLPAAGTTFVNIGFNGLAIGMDTLDATVALSNDKFVANTQILGTVYMKTLSLVLSTGSVEIYSHSGSQGVVINTNIVGAMDLAAISWGDNDGVDATNLNHAGFVGLTGLHITGLSLVGKIAIDVATIDLTVAATNKNLLMYAAYGTHNLSTSFVHIGLGTGNAGDSPSGVSTPGFAIGMTSMMADVVLANDKGLATNFGTLGSLWVSGLSAKMNGWVDIAAH